LLDAEFFNAFGAFSRSLLLGLSFIGVFMVVYVFLTPQKEIELIRNGNGPAALALGGAVVGFAIPLSRAIEISSSVLEAAIWAVVALLAQLLAQLLARLVLPKLHQGIEDGQWPGALVSLAGALAVGLVNAACMTP
jgi:putative membrane protein